MNQKKDRYTPSPGVTVNTITDKLPYLQDGDTQIIITGTFTISGPDRKPFLKDLGDLINRYRI